MNFTVSPRIGSSSNSSVTFSTAAASGYISFAADSLQMFTTEPDSGFSTLKLSVERGGLFGEAVIIWSITAVSASFIPTLDVLIPSGTITIMDGWLIKMNVITHPFPSLLTGRSNTTLDVLINADDVPELDEVFNVTLLTVSSPLQRLAASGVG